MSLRFAEPSKTCWLLTVDRHVAGGAVWFRMVEAAVPAFILSGEDSAAVR